MSETIIDVTRYTYRVTWSVEDDQYVATCVELPSLSWLADTQEDALGGLRDLVAAVVRDLSDTGEPVPEPLSSRPTRASSTSESANSSTADSPSKPPKNTSASTNTSSADSATLPEPRAEPPADGTPDWRQMDA